MSAPTRLLEDTSIPQKLRDDLRHTQGAVILPFDTAAGLARLRAGLEVGATVAPPAAAGGLVGVGAWKVLAALGVAGGIGWALLGSGDGGDPSVREATSSEAAPPSSAKAPEVPPEPVVAPSPSPAPESDTSLEPPVRTVADTPNVASPASASATTAEPSDPALEEIAHLGALRKLHHQDPAAAIIAARDGHAKFSAGMLYEEREALLILSLQRVGQSAEANRRIEAFQSRFPKSAFLSKMGASASPQGKGEVKPAP